MLENFKIKISKIKNLLVSKISTCSTTNCQNLKMISIMILMVIMRKTKANSLIKVARLGFLRPLTR